MRDPFPLRLDAASKHATDIARNFKATLCGGITCSDLGKHPAIWKWHHAADRVEVRARYR
jgi:hypothetical protein